MEAQAAEKRAKIKHFSSILFVEDRNKSLAYYENLGFWCDYQMGFVEREGLMLILHETADPKKIVPNYPVHGENSLDMFVMVDGVEQLYEEFISKKAIIHYELRTNSFAMREFAIRDLDGYTIGFGEPYHK
jgi:hypothetical protein